jgi:hypothetical protein
MRYDRGRRIEMPSLQVTKVDGRIALIADDEACAMLGGGHEAFNLSRDEAGALTLRAETEVERQVRHGMDLFDQYPETFAALAKS